MPWGKHRGRPLELVPEDYLLWVLDHAEKASPTLRQAIRTRLRVDLPKASAGVPPQDLQRVVAIWHRRQILRWHPDKQGGDNRVAAALNNAVDELREMLAEAGKGGRTR